MNEYDDLIKQDQTEALRGSMFAAGSGQPDAEAQLQKLSARTGVPLEAVRIKRQEVEFQDKLNSFDYEKVIKESPKLSAWLSDPKNAALAHDDWQNLSAMEKTFAYAKDYTGALAGGLVGDAVGSTLSGVSTLIDVGARAMDRPVRAAFGDKVANAFWYDAPTIGGISIDPLASLKATGKTIKAAGDWMKPPVDRQNLATDVAGGIGQIGGQIAVQLMTGGAISLGTLYAQGADVMATKTAKDVADPALKDTAILAGGAITAITEKYGLDKLLNRVPPEVKNRTLRFIADKVAAGGIEAGQELAEGLLHDIARRTLTNKDAELLDGVGREMSAAALSAAIVRGALGIKGHARAKEQEQFIKSLTDTAADSKLRERMPEKFKAYLDSVTAGGPVENIFIPADKFASYFQEAGLDPAAMASKLGVQNYPEASVAGTDVVIPTSEFVTQLSGSDHLQGLWSDLRFNQGDMTLNESRQYERDQDATPIDDETLKRMTGVDQARPGFESVKTQIMGELVGRFDRSTAESYATQYAAVITTLAERSGQDPLALAKKYDLSVNMPIPDALRQKLGKVDIEMDPMLDRLRAGDIPKPEKVLGQSLYEFVRDAGGLKDSSEARNMDESIRRNPGQKKIVQPGGMSADAALQYAMEAGYFPGKTDLFETDLLDAMQEDIGGNRVYAPYNGNDAAANEYRMLTEMQAWLDGIGADLATMTNAQVRARIQEVAASDVANVYEQAVPPETGKPIRLFFNRNQESSTQFAQAPGTDVGRSIEPAGEYMNVDRTTQLKAPDGRWEAGVVSFQNPLVLAHKSTDSNGWKQDLSEMFGGKTGKALSEAVQAAGHDGIITFDKYGLSETVNLNGEKVAGATTLYQAVTNQTQTKAFKDWFGESKVVDAKGKPLVVYHGGNAGIEVFENAQKRMAQFLVPEARAKIIDATFFTKDRRVADSYKKRINDRAYSDSDPTGVMYETYLSIKNPMVIDMDGGKYHPGKVEGQMQAAKAAGHDGMIVNNIVDDFNQKGKPTSIYITFAPTQIKSATGNSGAFDGSNPNILYQAADGVTVSQKEGSDFLSAKSEAGEVGGHVRDGALRVSYAEIDESMRGKGHGIDLYRSLVDDALAKGLRVFSDSTVDAPAVRVYEALGRRGYEVKRLDGGVLEGGAVYGKGASEPAFEIVAGPAVLNQADNTDKRGSITIGADRKMQISLFEKANLSTFLHETGHFYLEVMGDLATAEGANPQIQEDYSSILQWMGVTSRAGIEVKHHEMFARANEAYLMEGKSPSPELQGAFQRFRAWLLHVYKTVAALDVPISDEIRQVFDRMYATDAQIEAALGENQFTEMFATAADAGMSEAEFKAYSASVQQTVEQGKERLQTKLMGELQRERTKVWKEEREKVRGEVAAEVDAVPVYQAFKALSDGQTEDGIEIKLSRADFIKQYSKEFLKSLPRGFQRIYAAEGGVNIDTAAEMFGFDSGKAMIEQLVNMKPRAALVEQMTDDRMKERFGDIRFDGTFADEALNALHNDQRENVLKIELRAIRKKAAEGEMFVKAERARVRDAASAERQSQQDGAQFVADALPQKEQNRTTKDGRAYSFMAFDPEPMRRAAAGIIGQKQIKDLRPYSFLLAERDAAKLGAKAMKAKDYMTAAEQKQRELFNHYLYKEATKVVAEVERKSGWLADQGGTKKRQALGKAGADYLEQVDEILERYEFKTVPLNKLARRESLAAWVNAQEALGNAVAVPEDVLNEARRVNWKQIPVDELRAVFDSVKNITHLASLKNELLVKGQRRNYEEVKQELISSIYAAPLKPTGEFSLPNMKGASLLQRGAAAWKRYDAAHMKIEQIVEWLDDGNIDGAWARNFFDLADSAQTTEYDLHRRVTTVLNDLRLAMPKDWQNALFDRVEFDLPLVTGQGKAAYVKPTRYTLLSIALNMGNEQNAQRLRDGNKLNDVNLQKVRDALTDADWQFVQGVWDSVELLWPDMAALEKRVSGIVPEKVEPAQFSIRGKDYRGGYFPLVYDSRVSAIGEKQVEGDKSIESFLSSGFGRPSTNKGATKKRMETISQPVLLDMNDVLGGHIAKVVKDISHREAVMGLHRILTDEQIKAALIDRLGEAYYREMRDWTKVLVNDRTDSMNAAKGMSKVAMQARTNLAIVTMGWKISTMLSQFAGFGSSADLVKPSYLGRALIQAANSPNETWAMIAEKSGEMRNRVQTIDRDVRDSMRRIADKKSIVADIQRTAFVLTSYADRMVSVPTWLGGYNQAIAEGLGEEAAVRNGDRAVRLSQGAGGAKDLAAVQRNNELMKLMTMYYTPFSALYARLRDIGHQQAVQGIGYLPTAVARSIALVALPAVLGNMLAGRGPDDDEDEVWWSIRQMLMYPIAALPGVRDFSGLMEQKFIALSGEGKMNFSPSYSLSPIVSAIGKAYANLVSKPIDVLAGTREMDAELAWGAFESAGLVAGLPTAQVKITGSYLTDLISGEAQPENAGEVLRDLLFRRKKE